MSVVAYYPLCKYFLRVLMQYVMLCYVFYVFGVALFNFKVLVLFKLTKKTEIVHSSFVCYYNDKSIYVSNYVKIIRISYLHMYLFKYLVGEPSFDQSNTRASRETLLALCLVV